MLDDGHGVVDGAFVGDVCAESQGRVVILGLQFGGCSSGFVAVEVDDRDAPAVGGKPVDDGTADAPSGGGAGDHSGSVDGETLPGHRWSTF